jgi:hypothetical protein
VVTTQKIEKTPPTWMRNWLLMAAFYNALWGAWVVLFPFHLFDLTHMARPNYPELWQCVGMIVGCYAVGYFFASFNAYRYWPVIAVGLLGKILGPIGFAKALIEGTFSPWFGLNILTNDLIWWIPFTLMLKGAYEAYLSADNDRLKATAALSSEQIADQLASYKTTAGDSLVERSHQANLLLVFVRHMGCTYCRETLEDLALAMPELTAKGIQPVVVHMGEHAEVSQWEKFPALATVPQVLDPSLGLYKLAQLPKGKMGQLLGLRVWIRGVEAGFLKGHGVGALQGDGFQLGGYAWLKNGVLTLGKAQADAQDRLDFGQVCSKV